MLSEFEGYAFLPSSPIDNFRERAGALVQVEAEIKGMKMSESIQRNSSNAGMSNLGKDCCSEFIEKGRGASSNPI
jgi:hypothetical protein